MEVSLVESVLYGLAAILTFLLIRHFGIVKAFLRTPGRDIRALVRLTSLKVACQRALWSNLTVFDAFDATAKKYPEKICFHFEDEVWTFREVQEYANKIANYFSKDGYSKGDKVAFIMENRPEYVATWLGLSKIGVITSLININWRQESLKHALEILPHKGIIYEEETAGQALKEVIALGYQAERLYCSKKMTKGSPVVPPLENWVDLEAELMDTPVEFSPIKKEQINFNDPLYYSFTSGTTGFPKAAVIKHSRFLMCGFSTSNVFRLKLSDVLYTPLPLYHTTGGMLGISTVLVNGTTGVLRKKFSASNFLKDCIKYKVTAAQYIGETLRYLYSQPRSELDRKHGVRKFFGLGLRGDLWEDFVERFGVSDIVELYGSTEGNCNMANMFGKPGSCGFIPVYVPILPYKLVKVTEDGDLVRNSNTGKVVVCQVNEPGELIGKIYPKDPLKDFEGYSDKASTGKKIIKNVFEEGDLYFRSGDILMQDELGYFYFKDRTGDTFRWKGENVSTQQVELVISKIYNLRDVAVYGVKIPCTEGRAGMAAVAIPSDKLDLEHFTAEIFKKLPNYARPLFIRATDQLDFTSTHKIKKNDLQKDGFDIRIIKDPIYFLAGSQYVPLTEDIFNSIMNGQVRL